MGIHVTDLLRFNFCIAHGRAHHPECAISAFRRLCDVICIAGHSIARHFGEDFRAAFFRALQRAI